MTESGCVTERLLKWLSEWMRVWVDIFGFIPMIEWLFAWLSVPVLDCVSEWKTMCLIDYDFGLRDCSCVCEWEYDLVLLFVFDVMPDWTIVWSLCECAFSLWYLVFIRLSPWVFVWVHVNKLLFNEALFPIPLVHKFLELLQMGCCEHWYRNSVLPLVLLLLYNGHFKK